MAMDTLMFVAGAIGFAPAIAVLWYLLRDYDYPRMDSTLFSDTKVFILVAVGMVAGTVIFIMEGATKPYYMFTDDLGERVLVPDMAILLYVVTFSLVEEGAKLVVLLFPAMRKGFDNIFYGVGMGAGMSAVAVLETVFVSVGQAGTLPSADWFIAIVLYSIALAMAHASTGAIIGDACHRGRPWPGFARAFAIRASLAAMMLPYFFTYNLWLSVPAMVVVAFLILTHVQTRVIPRGLPEEVQSSIRQRRGRRRKAADI
jgi:hypothetical protein